MQETKTTADALSRAVEYLGAVEVAPGRYAWLPGVLASYHVTDTATLGKLAAELRAADKRGAYRKEWNGEAFASYRPSPKHIRRLEAMDCWLQENEAEIHGLPSWWSPTCQAIQSCELCARGVKHFACDLTATVTASLETGEEIPA